MKHSKSVRVYGKPLKSERVESAETPSWVVEEPPVFLVVKVDKAKVAEAKKVEPVKPPAPVTTVEEDAPVTPPPVAEKKVKAKKTKTVTPPAPKVVTPVPNPSPTYQGPKTYRYTAGLWAKREDCVRSMARTLYAEGGFGERIPLIGQEVLLTVLTHTGDVPETLKVLSRALKIPPSIREGGAFERVSAQAWVDLLLSPPNCLKGCFPQKVSGMGTVRARERMIADLRRDGFDVK